MLNKRNASQGILYFYALAVSAFMFAADYQSSGRASSGPASLETTCWEVLM